MVKLNTSAGFSILISGLIIYNYKREAASLISPSNGIRAVVFAAHIASRAINRTNISVNNLRSRFPDRSYGYSEDLENKSEHRDNYEHNYDADLVINQYKKESPYMFNPTLTMFYLNHKYINKVTKCLIKTGIVAMGEVFPTNGKFTRQLSTIFQKTMLQGEHPL